MSAKPFRHSDRGESLSSCEKFGAGRIPEDHGRDSCRRSLSEFYCQNPLNLKVLNREENASICSTECVNGSIGFIGFHREVQRKCRGSAEEAQRKCRGLIISHGGSHDSLAHWRALESSVKTFRHSDRGEPLSSREKFGAGLCMGSLWQD